MAQEGYTVADRPILRLRGPTDAMERERDWQERRIFLYLRMARINVLVRGYELSWYTPRRCVFVLRRFLRFFD